MATSNKGRSYPYFGSSWGMSSTSGWGGSSTNKRTKAKRTASSAGGSTGYKSVCSTLEKKINSYRVIVGQTKGAAGRFPRPTPATLNSFANWVNKGAIIQTVSPTQVARWSKSTKFNFNTKNPSPTTCKNVLCAKYGKSAIKAVCRTANGSFLVATAPTVKGRAFHFAR